MPHRTRFWPMMPLGLYSVLEVSGKAKDRGMGLFEPTKPRGTDLTELDSLTKSSLHPKPVTNPRRLLPLGSASWAWWRYQSPTLQKLMWPQSTKSCIPEPRIIQPCAMSGLKILAIRIQARHVELAVSDFGKDCLEILTPNTALEHVPVPRGLVVQRVISVLLSFA